MIYSIKGSTEVQEEKDNFAFHVTDTKKIIVDGKGCSFAYFMFKIFLKTSLSIYIIYVYIEQLKQIKLAGRRSVS